MCFGLIRKGFEANSHYQSAFVELYAVLAEADHDNGVGVDGDVQAISRMAEVSSGASHLNR